MARENKNLNAAKSAKKDEFYTQLEDISKELKYYKDYFRNKVVFCNCDDPYESNFFKYFALNFNALGLKKLIATCYDGSPISGDELPLIFDCSISTPKKIAYKVEITEVQDYNGDGRRDLTDIRYLIENDKNVLSILQGNGDFRSEECVELLKQADIVVTNPPFSLFREYVAQLIEYDKKFLIIGNQNALKYKEIFPLVICNKLWLGITMNGSNRWFQVPDSYPTCHKIENGKKYAFVAQVVWFTNMEHCVRNEELILYKHYTPEEYPKYDNFDAINVDKAAEIPADYDGVMGVPITFLHKYNPHQFELVGVANHGIDNEYDLFAPKVHGKELYTRILIRKKTQQ